MYSSGAQRGRYRPILGGGKVLRGGEINFGSRGAVGFFWGGDTIHNYAINDESNLQG